MAPTPHQLLEQARASVPGSPEWILYTEAAFDALVENPMILVGGGAQVVYTQQRRPTDVDLVGRENYERLLARGGSPTRDIERRLAWKRSPGDRHHC